MIACSPFSRRASCGAGRSACRPARARRWPTLKVLVAVGAPDEGASGSAVLDYERELQNILNAVEPLSRYENAEVRILEVGHPEEIARAIERDAYHVLHLSCHGGPGTLELEDEDGQVVPTTADELIAPLKGTGRPVPLVFLNTCHGAVQGGRTASFAEALLRAGVPAVLAMQTSVSDHYASAHSPAPSTSIWPAASICWRAGRSPTPAGFWNESGAPRSSAGESLDTTQPEYATAALFVARDEQPLANFALDKVLLGVRPVYEAAGPVPQLRLDDLIGRRKELRECLRALRDGRAEWSGVVLTGIGGVGKSALAGRVMQRLLEDGYLVPAHAGRLDVAGITDALRNALVGAGSTWAKALQRQLARTDLDDRDRLGLVREGPGRASVVLVLDDFEQNLNRSGRVFLNPDVEEMLANLAKSARRGRLLITCRNPIPRAGVRLEDSPVGPLSPAETRKLVLRLDALDETDERARILSILGGHPRSLEFVNVLLGGKGRRLPAMLDKLEELLGRLGLDADSTFDGADQALQQALALGARDIMLKELLAIARDEQIDAVLLQVGGDRICRATPSWRGTHAGKRRRLQTREMPWPPIKPWLA